MRCINIKTSLRKYPVYLGDSILKMASVLIKEKVTGLDKVFLLTNETVYSLYSDHIKALCRELCTEYEIFILKDGEKYKSIDSAGRVYSRLIELNFHRNDSLITFGGGVIGDTGGYIASTFHRGMKLVHIPTTIIGQVDSSIGGKVAVNFEGRKNIIGSFYQPHIIIMDTRMLKTLKKKEIINGLGEIVKYGLVFDRIILEKLQDISERKDYCIDNIVSSVGFGNIIMECIRIKARIVEKDEFDTGHRNLLNFGHTIGHSLENIFKLEDVNHGQAVSMGMIAALEMSVKMGLFPEKKKEDIVMFFRKLGIPHAILETDAEKVLEGLRYDKKFTSGTNRFILLKDINKPVIVDGVKKDIIIDSINNCINK
jgi:3-dehydroquinate synthase